jgi:hypothetical protein
MESPKNLKHQPIISVNDYDRIDAQNANDTDAKALSIGKAQYNNEEISLKVWREGEDKWSRQSEELPIHRVFDLAILALASEKKDIRSNFPDSLLREVVDKQDEVKNIHEYFEKHEQYLKPRIQELGRLIKHYLEKVN